MDIVNTTEYENTLKVVTGRIKEGQYKALQKVNLELIRLYRDIGKIVSKTQRTARWGDEFLFQLSKDIAISNPGIKGFSKTNLFYMMSFYNAYEKNQIVQALTEQISWTHNVAILDRCKDHLQREYYIRASNKYGWSSRLLINKIESQDYERFLTSQSNFDNSLQKGDRQLASASIKDDFVFNFLNLSEEYSEKQLENLIMSNIERFLLEMNTEYFFVGRQYKIEVSNKEFFIDLLLFHRYLRCFVAIDLKVGEFRPEYAGKMSFYLTALNREIKTDGENKSIGIIICKEKDRTLVEYTLADINKPMSVATFRGHNTLPKEYAKYLPNEEEIIKRLLNI